VCYNRLLRCPCLELDTPVEFDALPQDRHFAFAAEGFVLAVARDVGVCSRGKRLDDDPVQHRADGGALAVGAPRFPRIADPLRWGDVAHHGGRSGEPVILPPRGADVVLGALPDIQPVGPVDHPAGVVAACLLAPFLGVPDLLQQFRAARRVLVFRVSVLNRGAIDPASSPGPS
jgi:hypothetical protein